MNSGGLNTITDVGKRKENARAKEFAAQHSPDLSKLTALKLDRTLTIYVEPEKLKKLGINHYYEKYGVNPPSNNKNKEDE